MKPAEQSFNSLRDIVPPGHGLVVFDGECVLCNATVAVLLKYDKSKRLYFTKLKSETLASVTVFPDSSNSTTNSVILISDGRIYTESSAILGIAGILGGIFKLALAAYIVPGFFRNMLYRLVARNRYKWFGRRTQCFVPPEAERQRFLP